MKKKIAMRFAILCLLVALLNACSTSQKQEIYSVLDAIDVSEYTAASLMLPSYDTPSRYIDRYPEEYEALAAYGQDGVTYILQYVIEHEELDYLNAMFFVCCSYRMLGLNEFLDMDLRAPVAHARALQEYLP